MNVRTLCLSILYEGDATGYEIRRLSVDGECSYFVEASFGSIYPALAKLEADGLVSSHIEPQDGKPARKVYSITDAGRKAFIEALSEPLGEEVYRSPFLLFARFAHLLPRTLVEQRLKEQLERFAVKRQKLLDMCENHEMSAGDTWIVNFGLDCIGFGEQKLRQTMPELIALAQAPSTLNDAAE